MACGDTENTLEQVQVDSAMVTSYEDLSQVVYVLCFLLRPHDEVVETNQHDVHKIAEALHHGTLEGGSSIFESKGHDSLGECAPWGCEFHLVTVFFPDLDLVIFGKTVHEREGFMPGACIDDLVDERCGEVVFGTCLLRREIPMAWGTKTDNLTPEINPFQYAIEIKCLTLKDQTSYLTPDS